MARGVEGSAASWSGVWSLAEERTRLATSPVDPATAAATRTCHIWGSPRPIPLGFASLLVHYPLLDREREKLSRVKEQLVSFRNSESSCWFREDEKDLPASSCLYLCVSPATLLGAHNFPAFNHFYKNGRISLSPSPPLMFWERRRAFQLAWLVWLREKCPDDSKHVA